MTNKPSEESGMMSRDEIARIIDPSAWYRIAEIRLNLEFENAMGRNLQKAAADRLAIPSRIKADAILARLAPAPEQIGDSVHIQIFWSDKDQHVLCVNEREVFGSIEPGVSYRGTGMDVPAATLLAALAQPEAARVGDTPQSASEDGQGREAFQAAAFDLFDAACLLRDAIEDARPGNTIASSMPDLRKALTAFDDATLATAPASSVADGRLREALEKIVALQPQAPNAEEIWVRCCKDGIPEDAECSEAEQAGAWQASQIAQEALAAPQPAAASEEVRGLRALGGDRGDV